MYLNYYVDDDLKVLKNYWRITLDVFKWKKKRG